MEHATQPRPTDGSRPAWHRRVILLLASSFALAMVAVLVWSPPRSSVPPLFRNLRPTERFDSLFNRAMSASQAGDAGAVDALAAQALSNFRLVSRPSADRRFHAALLAMHNRDDDLASSLANDILDERPVHLLGLLVRVTVAGRTRDVTTRDSLTARFLAAYHQELTAPLLEYRAHRPAIDRFLEEIERRHDNPGR